MTSKIEKELLAATKEKPIGKGEKRQDYIDRIAAAVNEMETKAFNKMSDESQSWFNRAIELNGKGKPVPDFGDGEKPKLSLGKKESTVATPKKALKKAAPAKKGPTPKAGPTPKKALKKATKKAAPAKRHEGQKDKLGYRSMAEAIRHIVASKPDISVEAMTEKLNARGFEGNESRIYDNFIHAKGTIKVLHEMGLTKINCE